MKFDFSSLPLRNRAFSDRPMAFLDAEPRAMLSAIMEMAMIETGHPAARSHWQQSQLRHLFDHARSRSAFWQKRIGSRKISDVKLASLPVLTREELRQQVASEGSLLRPADGIPVMTRATSGSTGQPVEFFFSEVNGRLNTTRSFAQYFIEGRDLSLNRTRLLADYTRKADGFAVEKSPSWAGALAPVIRSGTSKQIEYLNPDVKALVGELRKDSVGYLVCAPFMLETILDTHDASVFRDAGTAMVIPLGEHVSEVVMAAFAALRIPLRATYSSEEVGPIAFECAQCAGHFHVAASNVMVEVIDRTHEVGKARLGRVLVTNLHSHATPFIRYDLGDLATLEEQCPCGHEGATISNLYGRLGSVLKHRDGRLSPFSVLGRHLAARATFKDYRIRQTTFETIVVEIGGRTELSEAGRTALMELMTSRVGPGFRIDIRACTEIDWGASRKRLGFRCEV